MMLFQCSSASRKFSINPVRADTTFGYSFSALQRAENSQFQRAAELMLTAFRFSALQRAENSQSVL